MAGFGSLERASSNVKWRGIDKLLNVVYDKLAVGAKCACGPTQLMHNNNVVVQRSLVSPCNDMRPAY